MYVPKSTDQSFRLPITNDASSSALSSTIRWPSIARSALVPESLAPPSCLFCGCPSILKHHVNLPGNQQMGCWLASSNWWGRQLTHFCHGVPLWPSQPPLYSICCFDREGCSIPWVSRCCARLVAELNIQADAWIRVLRQHAFILPMACAWLGLGSLAQALGHPLQPPCTPALLSATLASRPNCYTSSPALELGMFVSSAASMT